MKVGDRDLAAAVLPNDEVDGEIGRPLVRYLGG